MQNRQLAVSPANHPKFAVLTRSRWTPARVKKFREQLGLSHGRFGKLFRDAEDLPNGYTRQYISRIERGIFPITQRFERNPSRVQGERRTHTIHSTNELRAVELEIISKGNLPKRVHIVSKPIQCDRSRCPVCKQNGTRYFVPHTPNQKRHVLPQPRRTKRRIRGH